MWSSRLVLPTLLAACGGAPEAYDSTGPTLSLEQRRELAAAEKAYRDQDPGFAARRDALSQDPSTAYWLARFLLRDLVWRFDRAPADDRQFLHAAAGRAEPGILRALRELRAMGPRAVPCIVEDLLKNRYSDRRELGVQVLGRLDASMIPALAPFSKDADPRLRRLCVEAIALHPPAPHSVQVYEAAITDRDFAVRAAGWNGLATAGAGQAPRLRAALLQEPDPYVRRSICRSLRAFPDRATASAILDYMQACLSNEDRDGQRAAEATLAKIAGKELHGISAWRQWLLTLPEQIPADGGRR
jgi:HEAT repeat protein